MTATPEIVRAAPDQAERVAALIAEAFQPLAIVAWLVPDPAQRRPRLAADFLIFVELAFEHGRVEVTGDLSAAAVWFPGSGFPAPPDYLDRKKAACGPFLERFLILDEYFAEHHPHEDHQHLAFLAVQPSRQSAGLGSLLLQRQHRRLDESGTPAYLEASSTRARDLYLRHGYRLRGEPFVLPDGPPFWPMWREPQGPV